MKRKLGMLKNKTNVFKIEEKKTIEFISCRDFLCSRIRTAQSSFTIFEYNYSYLIRRQFLSP